MKNIILAKSKGKEHTNFIFHQIIYSHFKIKNDMIYITDNFKKKIKKQNFNITHLNLKQELKNK